MFCIMRMTRAPTLRRVAGLEPVDVMAAAAHGDDDCLGRAFGEVGAGLRLLAPRGNADGKQRKSKSRTARLCST